MRLLAIALVLAAGSALFAAILSRPNLFALADRAAVDAGFGVVSAEIRGNRFTAEADIRAALALDGSRSQLTLDLAGIQNRIEALPWVRTAAVRRVLPYALAIDITERKAAAVWRGMDRDVLVDAQGRTLGAVPRGADTGLPILAGADAGPAAATILPLTNEYRRIQQRTVEIRRIAGRRWSLLLDGGTLVHLPGDGTAAALAWLDQEASAGLLDRGLAEIDLRVHGQLVVRAAPETAVRPLGAPAHSARTAAAGPQ